jgi:hypothetical protein
MPMRSELPTAAAQTCARESVDETFWSSALAVASNRDLQVVAIFALIGSLLTVNAVLWFPDFGAAFAALATFP